jgi:hypothetical protein
VLPDAVVVDDDGPTAEARARPDVGITDVREVVGLDALAQGAVLDLDEVPDADPRAEHGPGAQVGAGPDHDVVVQLARLDGAVGLHVNTAPDPGGALNHAAGLDQRVAPDLHVQVDVGGRGIDDCDPVRHQLVQLPPAHGGPGLGELCAGIDAQGLLRVLQAQGLHAAAFANGPLHDVREVDLSLPVPIVDPGQGLPEQLRVEHIHAGVALLDGELLGGGVGRLHHLRHPTLAVAHDDSAHVHGRGQEHQVRARLRLERRHAPEGLGAEERRVAVEDQRVAVEVREGRPRLEHGVPGAPLLRLEHEAGAPGEGLLHGVRVPPGDDDQPGWIQPLGGRQRIVQHGPAGDRMQDLGPVRAHPRALAGRQDQDRDVTRFAAHLHLLFGVRRSRSDPRGFRGGGPGAGPPGNPG